MSTLLERAVELARRAHAQQLDKAGKPYIGHPLRVMAKLETEEERIVGVLHDVVEDSGITLQALRREGFSERVLEAIDAVTKRGGEEYEDYLRRVMSNRTALRVKIADMEDNMDPTRIAQPTPHDRARRQKYEKTLPRLVAALEALNRSGT